MHQSPQKQFGPRRDKYVAAFDLEDGDTDRRNLRTVLPIRTRRSQERDEAPRETRSQRQHPRG